MRVRNIFNGSGCILCFVEDGKGMVRGPATLEGQGGIFDGAIFEIGQEFLVQVCISLSAFVEGWR